MGKVKLQTETDRLVIRELKETDFESWLEGFENRRPSQYKYDEEKPDMSSWSPEQFTKVIEDFQGMADRDEVYVLGVFRKSDQKQLGNIEFSTILREEFQWGRLGYIIHNQYWGKGYGREAVSAGLRLAFEILSYHRIEAHINVDNNPSIRLAESVGMKYECVREQFIFENDAWTDNLVYYMNSD